MKTLIKISWRNIWRNRTRTIVIIIALILGIMGGVFSAALRLSAEQQQFEDTIENQISHIQIHHPDFIANPEAYYRIPDGVGLAEEIEQQENVIIATPRAVFDGMAASANMNTGVRIKGIDPEKEAQTTKLNEIIEKGTYFEHNGRLPSLVIGEELADEINADVGSRIVLTFQDIEGDVVNSAFRVEGLYSITSRDFEKRTIFARDEVINDLIGDSEAVTEIALLIDDIDNYREVAGELQKSYPDLKIRHWADLAPARHYALEVLDQALIWILVIIIMAISFGLLNTILMSILERVRELGVLMAIGMKRIRVFSMVVLETTMISLIGGFLGLLMSYGMIRVLNITGVKIPGGEGLEDFGYAEVLYPDIYASFYFEIAVVVIIFAILASIYPAWKAINIAPAEAVGKE